VAVETIETIPLRRPVTVGRWPGLVPARVVARRAIRGALIWGAVFGLVVWSTVSLYAKVYPTAADRVRAAAAYGSDVGTQALFGPVHHLETVAGYLAYHMVGFLGLIGAVWGLLAGTRLLRGEEEGGRWELLLAGQTTRRRAAAGAMAGLGIDLLTLWAVTAAVTVAMGRGADARFTVSASLFAALAAVAPAAMFLAVGALASQLAATRRRAAALAAAAFGVVYVIRLIAYSAASLRWLRWASPLAWVDELRPLTESRLLPLVPILGTTAVLAALAIALASRRDLGAGVLPPNDTAAPRTRLLSGPLGLTYRLSRGTAAGWIVGLAAGGLVTGLTAKSTAVGFANEKTSGLFSKLGGTTGGAVFLGMAFLLLALLAGMAAAGLVVATREEEAEGYLDHLLARPVARLRWLAGRFTVSVVALVVIGIAVGVFTWVAAAATGAGLSFSSLLAAGINVVPVGIFVLGIGTLAHGLAPRFVAAVAYGFVAWSFLVELVGASLGASRWLLDTSVLHHIARAPAVDVRWDSAALLVALGLAAAAVGAWRFARRDLAGA